MLGRRRTFSDFRRRNKFWNHIPACVVKSRVSKRVWDDYFKFCIERNPWDKTLSDFYMRKQRSGGELTFDDYMKRGRYPINYPRYTDGVNHENVIVDHVMRYENLNEELSNIFGRLGIPFQGSLDVRAKSGHRKDRSPYQEFFVGEYQEYRDAIARAFEREIEIHGYSFD
jgi:hypothetical protein